MTGLGYLLLAIARLLALAINIYTYVILASVLISWVNADPNNTIVRIVREITEPVYKLARKLIPSKLYRTGFDFAPLVTLIAIVLFDTIAVGFLFDLGKELLQR